MRLAEPFTFFVDRSLGGAFVAAAIREADQAVVAHDDEFDPNARDVDWLRAVGVRRWVVLTKDARIRTNALERGTLLSSNVAAFILGQGDMTGPRMASEALAIALVFALTADRQRRDFRVRRRGDLALRLAWG